MEIAIDLEHCRHLENLSSYDHNYYLLPLGVQINRSICMLEIYQEEYNQSIYVFAPGLPPFDMDTDGVCFVRSVDKPEDGFIVFDTEDINVDIY